MQSFFALLDLLYALLAAGALATAGLPPRMSPRRGRRCWSVGLLVVLRWGLTILTAKLAWSERLLAALILTMFLVSGQPRLQSVGD